MGNRAWTIEIRSKVCEHDLEKQTFVVDLRCLESLHARSFNCEAVAVLTLVNQADAKKSVIVREKKRFADESEETRRLSKPLELTIPRDHLRKETAEAEGWTKNDSFQFTLFLCANV